MKRKKKQQRIHKLLLNDAINERNTNVSHLRKTTVELKNAILDKTTWMKARLIVLSVNRLLSGERKKTTARHSQKLQRLLDMKTASEKLETNPNEVIVNLSGKPLTAEQIEILKLGLRHGLAARPNSLEMMAVSGDIYDQLERKQIWKEGFFTKERVKNALRSFTYNCLDLDLKQYFTDRRRIRILSALSKDFAILKPDKGNGIAILNRSDYTKSLRSIFDEKSKFTRLNEDPTSTRLNTLHNYLLTLRKRDEISESEFKFMRSKTASFGRAHGMPKTHKSFKDLPAFRPIIETTTTPHYNVGKFLSSLLNPFTVNDYNLRDSFHALSEIKTIPQSLFDKDYRFVSFDIVSLFTNVPLKRTIEIILKRVFENKLINTTLTNALEWFFLPMCDFQLCAN